MTEQLKKEGEAVHYVLHVFRLFAIRMGTRQQAEAAGSSGDPADQSPKDQAVFWTDSPGGRLAWPLHLPPERRVSLFPGHPCPGLGECR